MTEKVTILLKAVGDAPILKSQKYALNGSNDIAQLSLTIRKLLALGPDQSLFLYIAQSFAPSPDHTLQTLLDCYGLEQSKELVIHYSTTQAWG